MIKLFKPKFWNKKNSIPSMILLPIALFLQILIKIKKKISHSRKFNIPIICVGNILVGGTGKTPISIEIAKELKKENKKSVIVKKYYKNQYDEHRLIINKFDSLILKNNRNAAIEEAEQRGFDAVILDDGYQDNSFKKDLNIICFNSKQLIGNGLTFPSGPLREDINALKGAQIVIVNGVVNSYFEKQIYKVSGDISIYYSQYLPLNINQFKKKSLLAIAGIGNPDNFFNLLIENNLNVVKKVAFPDHYEFSRSELEQIVNDAKKDRLEIITTEKDYYRIKDLGFKNINFLKIKLNIFHKEKLMKEVLKYL